MTAQKNIEQAAVRLVTCSWCRAKPGKQCVTASGLPSPSVHHDRWNTARDKYFIEGKQGWRWKYKFISGGRL